MTHRTATFDLLLSASLLALSAAGCGGEDSSTSGSGTTSDSGTSSTSSTTPTVDPLAACGPVGPAWSRCAKNPLATAGHVHPDSRVELSIGDPDVSFDEDDQLWKAWWSTGLAEAFVAPEESIEMGIKYAESEDGVVWSIQEEPVLLANGASDEWDQLKLETPAVVKVAANPPDRRYVLAYAGAQGKKPIAIGGGNTVDVVWYQIGIAFSPDGKHFTRVPAAESAYAGVDTGYPSSEGLGLLGKDMLADTPGMADGLLADPELREEDGVLHLFTSSMAVNAQGVPLNFGVSHATSTDGLHWTPQPSNPQISGGAQPSLVRDPAKSEYELFYVQDSDADKAMEPSLFNPFLGVWRRTSTDLLAWSAPGATRDFTWDKDQKTEVYGLIAAGDMAFRDGVYRYYYPGWSAEGVPSGFLCPLHDGTYEPAVIVLNMALRSSAAAP